MTHDLLSVLSNRIDKSLVAELLRDYRELKKRHLLGDLEPAIAAAGRFCEDIMKCLVYLEEGELPTKKGIGFEDEYKRIKEYSKDTVEAELLYLIIPRAARGIYAIRSKKRGSHARGKDLLAIDLGYVVAACDWVLASLLFAVHGVSEDEAIDLMLITVRFTPPMLVEYDGYFALTKKGVKPLDALLVMLTSLGEEASYSDLAKQLKAHYSEGKTYWAYKGA